MNSRQNKGFILVEVALLTLIVGFTALIVVRGFTSAVKSNQMTAIRTAAVHIANAQMAEIEYQIDMNKQLPASFDLLEDNFLTYENFLGMAGPIKFNVQTKSTELNFPEIKATKYSIDVKVNWTINDKNSSDDDYEELTKDIWINTD